MGEDGWATVERGLGELASFRLPDGTILEVEAMVYQAGFAFLPPGGGGRIMIESGPETTMRVRLRALSPLHVVGLAP